MSGASVVLRQSLVTLARERTVLLVAGIYAVMVVVSAWLGWSATNTVNAIYHDAAAYLRSAGQAIPPNPVTEGSALAVLRNLTIYVVLIGSFVAIVMGQRLVEGDRRAGILPLVGTRPGGRRDFAFGKLAALAMTTGALTLLSAAVASVTLMLMPGMLVGASDWLHLGLFFLLSWGYMTIFGALALGAAARISAPSGGLLAATVVWLAVTFVLPALTANVNPTAAINPVSALANAPQTPLFHWLGLIFGPLSLSEGFDYLAADLMGYLPADLTPRGLVPPLPDLLVALLLATGFGFAACRTIDLNAGGPDV